jgi:hypothetical protein
MTGLKSQTQGTPKARAQALGLVQGFSAQELWER